MCIKQWFLSNVRHAIKLGSLAVCIASVFCVGCGKREDGFRFAVFDNGSYLADIVVPEKMGGVEKYAVEELVYHFKKAFGKAPQVVSEANCKAQAYPFHIYIGATKAASAAGLPVGDLADEEHCVKTVGNGLYLLGGDGDTTYEETLDVMKVAKRGTLYAVYDFLEEEMSVRWLWPGELGEVIPKRTEFSVGALSRRAVEPMSVRHFFMGIGGNKVKTGFTNDASAERFTREQKKLMVRQRHGKRVGFKSGHRFAQWWKNYHKKHPEYFNLLPNGKRMPNRAPELTTICVSEPGVWKERAREWSLWWKTVSARKRNIPFPWVNCCENDAAGLCTCARCRSWDGPDPRFEKSPYWNGCMAEDYDKKYLGRKFPRSVGLSAGGRWVVSPIPPTDEFAASLSDRYVRFYNEVAKEAKKYHPDAKAIGYAYANYIEPPMKTRVGEDSVIIFVPRSYFPYDKVESDNFRKQWGGWVEMGAKHMVYRPNYMLAGGNHPIDTARLILEDFAFAYTNGMFACQQDSLTGSWAAQTMQLYSMMRAMRDPLRGYEKARADMLLGFGKAADVINRYFDRVERHSAKWTCDSFREIGLKNVTGSDVGGSFRNPNAILGDFFDEAFFIECNAILDEGVKAAAGDAEVVARIEFLRKGLRDTELGRLCRIAQKASGADPKNKEKKAAYDAAFKAMTDYRASVEDDFVCDYSHHANWERMFVGWPHKVRNAKVEPKKVPPGKKKPADWFQGE